ncbi:MAG: FHA domain-containing protein [Desulfobacteraceae bacterium]|nr:MAG: FHA domain-containing protein [Desulfobacteraceae bacterium]
MKNDQVLKIELAIKDNVLKEFAFTQDKVEIGRIPTADVFIDNSGISRCHTIIERSIGGPYIVKDMGSTNGTFLNDRQVSEAALKNNDVISIGKFSLRVTIESADKSASKSSQFSPDDFDGTTVLSAEQMAQLRSSIANDKQNDRQKVFGQNISLPENESSGISLSQMLLWGGAILAVIVIGFLLFK